MTSRGRHRGYKSVTRRRGGPDPSVIRCQVTCSNRCGRQLARASDLSKIENEKVASRVLTGVHSTGRTLSLRDVVEGGVTHARCSR